ncbi:MAG: potassium channel family protein [Bacteroidota bacterium]
METENEDSRTKIIVSSTTLIGWIAAGTLIFHRLEDWTWIQSFYFSVVTITTVGYGDLTPSTEMSRLFTAIYILVGVSVGLVTLSLIGAEILKSREKSYTKRNKNSREK